MVRIGDSSVKAKCFSPSDLRALSYANAGKFNDSPIAEFDCDNNKHLGLSIATDIVFAILPIPMLWNVQINSRAKVAVFGILSLGVFASAASIIKTSYIGNYGKTGDFLWDSQNLTIWTATECNVGILAASIPCLKPLFKAMLDKSGYSSDKNRKRDTRGYYVQDSKQGHSLTTFRRGERDGPHGGLARNEANISATASKSSANVMSTEIPSEESILPLQSNGIMKTMQIQIQSEERDLTHRKDSFSKPRSVEDRV